MSVTFAFVVQIFDDLFEVAAAERGEYFFLILATNDDVAVYWKGYLMSFCMERMSKVFSYIGSFSGCLFIYDSIMQ